MTRLTLRGGHSLQELVDDTILIMQWLEREGDNVAAANLRLLLGEVGSLRERCGELEHERWQMKEMLGGGVGLPLAEDLRRKLSSQAAAVAGLVEAGHRASKRLHTLTGCNCGAGQCAMCQLDAALATFAKPAG